MKGFVLAAATAATMLVSGNAQAVTYATYGQLNSSDTIAFDHAPGTGDGGTLHTIGTPTVDFWFTVMGIPAVYSGHLNATMNLNATSTTDSVVTGTTIQQVFQTGSVSYTLGSTNLLTIGFTNMNFSGEIGGGDPHASATWTLAMTTNSTLALTSDVINFANLDRAGLSFSMTDASPLLSVDPDGTMASFASSSSGVFSSTPAPTPIPEPGMLGLFGFGAIALGLARRRTK